MYVDCLCIREILCGEMLLRSTKIVLAVCGLLNCRTIINDPSVNAMFTRSITLLLSVCIAAGNRLKDQGRKKDIPSKRLYPMPFSMTCKGAVPLAELPCGDFLAVNASLYTVLVTDQPVEKLRIKRYDAHAMNGMESSIESFFWCREHVVVKKLWGVGWDAKDSSK